MNNTLIQSTLIPGKLYCLTKCKLGIVKYNENVKWVYMPKNTVVMFIKSESTPPTHTRYFVIYKNDILKFVQGDIIDTIELFQKV